jgi:hypothetical protein
MTATAKHHTQINRSAKYTIAELAEFGEVEPFVGKWANYSFQIEIRNGMGCVERTYYFKKSVGKTYKLDYVGYGYTD